MNRPKDYKPRIVTVANQKGGVGKTTTVMNLGVAFARKELRVLLVDNDPQGNLTSYLGVRTQNDDDFISTLDELYLSKRPFSMESVRSCISTTASGVDLIPADQSLAGVDYYLLSRTDKEKILFKALNLLKSDYDVVLIDNPPSLNLLTLNSIYASDFVLIPLQAEFFSLEGVVKIQESIDRAKEDWNPDLSILGLLPTLVPPRRKLTREVIGALEQEFGDLVLKTMIHDNAAVTESTGHGKSVLDYQRLSRGAKEYMAAAEEILKRLGWQAEDEMDSAPEETLSETGKNETLEKRD